MSAVGSLLGLVILAQVSGLPAPPQRDAPAKASTGTSSISGRVIAADTGLPLPRAVVRVTGGPQTHTLQTDGEGRYTITRLSPGSYTVIAEGGPHRAGYLTMGYGASPPQTGTVMRPRPIQLDAGQRLENIDMRLERAAAITGRVTDVQGEPVARVQVRVLRIQRGQRPLPGGMSMITDDVGNYRVFGLSPGEYVVYANTQRGEMPRSAEGETVGFSLTYAPGTANIAQATRVRLVPGAVGVADVQLVETKLFSITGTVITSSGEAPRHAGVSATRADLDIEGPLFGSSVSQAGAFTLQGVPPGSYDLHVRHAPDTSDPNAQELGTVRVEVHAADVDGVVLATRPGETVTGEIVFDDGVGEGRRVTLSTQTAERRMFSSSPRVEVKGTTFTVRGIFVPVVLRGGVTQTLLANWALKAVLLDGRDVTDVPTNFTSRDSGRLQVIFTNRWPVLEGTVTDDAGNPLDDCTVVAFNEDPASWTPLSMSIRTARPGPKGKYVFRGLREGRYRVVAVAPDVSIPLNPTDPEFMERLKTISTPVLLNTGETRVVDLRLVSLER